MKLLALLSLTALPLAAAAQAAKPAAADVRHYGIEVAGLRVGTMTATRQAPVGADVTYSLVSDVKVNFLLYHLKIYYQVTNRFHNGQLLLSTVEAHTNQGDFASRAEWKGDHYDIVADQYKHHYKATEPTPIRYAVTNMFFGEPPAGQTRAFAEYFGDYFALSRGKAGSWQAVRDGREDEYQYANGQLVTIIKKNPLKNFVIRLLPE
jgi:hypothetical protein